MSEGRVASRHHEFVRDAVRTFQNMSALRAVQAFLRRKELASGRSWDEITTNLEDHLDAGLLDQLEVVGLLTDLRSRLQKLVSIYNVSKEVHAMLLDFGKRAEVKLSPIAERFPLDLSEQDLEGLDVKPRLIATRTTSDGIELFFTSARVGTRVEEIQMEEISADARPRYTSADRMYAERIERRQAFDIVFIPRKVQLIQIRIDALATTGRDRADWMRTQLEAMVIASADLTPLDFNALNLFPAVRSIYDDPKAGRLLGLQFDCATGANRRELMRKVRDSVVDLRDEPYHGAGTSVVAITPYWLSAEFSVPGLKVPETIQIVLPGSIRNLQGLSTLTAFEVSNFVSEPAIRHAVDVLFTHVQSP